MVKLFLVFLLYTYARVRLTYSEPLFLSYGSALIFTLVHQMIDDHISLVMISLVTILCGGICLFVKSGYCFNLSTRFLPLARLMMRGFGDTTFRGKYSAFVECRRLKSICKRGTCRRK